MRKRLALPRLCRNSNILIVIIVSQILAVLVWLLNDQALSFTGFGFTALYLLWGFLIPSMILCLLKTRIEALSFFLGSTVFILVILVCVFCMEWVLAVLFQKAFALMRWERVSLIAFVLSLGLIWGFGVLDSVNTRAKSEMESRVLALQNRIQPHFLFNSLNTISELTAVDPSSADRAINSLSLLFRASLEGGRRFHSVSQEIVLCEHYIELQKWRFGNKLMVNWTSDYRALREADYIMPKLVIQPLIENSITHGTLSSGHIKVDIDVRDSKKYLSFKVENEIGVPAKESGHGIALENIKERLFVLYDDQAFFQTKQVGDRYSVILRIPKYSSLEA